MKKEIFYTVISDAYTIAFRISHIVSIIRNIYDGEIKISLINGKTITFSDPTLDTVREISALWKKSCEYE
jgi:hypothetical protein